LQKPEGMQSPQLHRKGASMPSHLNQSISFLKPHAARSEKTIQYVLETFRRNGIDVVQRRTVTSEEIATGGLVDRHYAANARRGTFENALALELKDGAKEAFRIAFEEEWDDAVRAGKVVSGEVMRGRLGNISGEDLNTLWARYGAHKLSGGCYASWFEEEGCYVVNGFYPSVREQFTRSGAVVEILVSAFDMPWATFRRDIVGRTNPAAADEGSIRGYLHDHAAEFGLLVDSRDNVLHASASPFESLCEAQIWLPDRPLSQDPLWRQIHRKSGLSPKRLVERLLNWQTTNPLIAAFGDTGPILDVLQNHDTPDVASALLQLLAEA